MLTFLYTSAIYHHPPPPEKQKKTMKAPNHSSNDSHPNPPPAEGNISTLALAMIGAASGPHVRAVRATCPGRPGYMSGPSGPCPGRHTSRHAFRATCPVRPSHLSWTGPRALGPSCRPCPGCAGHVSAVRAVRATCPGRVRGQASRPGCPGHVSGLRAAHVRAVRATCPGPKGDQNDRFWGTKMTPPFRHPHLPAAPRSGQQG